MNVSPADAKAVLRQPIDAAMLRIVTDNMPPQPQPAAQLVRELRDSDRY